jgi:tetratricopeptide (TPR) repeat protein
MKLSALFILLTVVGAYPNPGGQVSTGAPAPSPQSPASEPAKVPATPREIAEIRGDIMNARKDYLGAAHAYEDLLVDDPRNALLLNKTGVAYQALGDSALADRYYKRALRVNKNMVNALNNIGTLEYAAGRYGRAIKYYRKAIERDSRSAPAYSNLGYAYTGNRQYAKALEAFGKALAIDPEIYSHHGGNGPLIEQRTAADPGMLFFLLAKSYAKTGDAEHTVRYLKLARDGGYTNFAAAAKDADFALVIKNPQVREALQLPPLPPSGSGGGSNGKSQS